MHPFAGPSSRPPAVAGTGLTVLDVIYAGNLGRPLKALGGSCGNVLISLAMLGHSVAPVISIGADSHGDFLVEAFRRAGCETRFVFRASIEGSPVIVEHIDVDRARHWFSSRCPRTDQSFPRWRSIDENQVRSARAALEQTSVFYTDRLSPAIVSAMEAAHGAGALVVLEPASRGDDDNLVARALKTTSILKISDDTAGQHHIASEETLPMVVIRTHGSRGLTAAYQGTEKFFPPAAAPRLVDTCGSGDMVTTGLLDYLLTHWRDRSRWSAADIYAGVEAGQRLAAINCAFAGARGIFHAVGARSVRSALDNGFGKDFIAYAMKFGPCDGYLD
jgi:fructokinase